MMTEGSGGLCEAKDWEEFFKLHGRCTVQLEFYYVAIALTGLGLLLLFVIVQGIIIMIFIHYACKHGRLKKSYDLDTNGTQKDNETLELQLRRGLVVNSQEDITDPLGTKHSLRNVSEDMRYSYDKLHDSQPVLNQTTAAPIQEGTYDAIGDMPNLNNAMINNPQYASVDQNKATVTPPPPPPPPPNLPGTISTGNKREEPAEVFNIGEIGAVSVGSYQYASVDKSSKEQAPPLPPMQVDLTTVDTNKWAPVQDTQYAVVDKTRSYDTPLAPTPPPPPPPPPPPAPTTEDYTSSSVNTNPSRGAKAQTIDPTVQLQAAIEALYDSVQ